MNDPQAPAALRENVAGRPNTSSACSDAQRLSNSELLLLCTPARRTSRPLRDESVGAILPMSRPTEQQTPGPSDVPCDMMPPADCDLT